MADANFPPTIAERKAVFGGAGGTVDKVETYGWTIKDEPGEYRLIKKGRLSVNENYQRRTSAERVAAIRAQWSWVACGALMVAKRGDQLWVMDGQHRLAAAKARSDIHDLPCLIFDVLGVEEEATGFLSANVNRKSMSTFDKWRAMLVAGDPLARRMEVVFGRLGVRLLASTKKREGRSLAFIGTCVRVARDDFDGFEAVTELLVAMCQKRALPEVLFSGLLDLRRRGVDLEEGRVHQRLINIGADRLEEAARRAAALYAKGGPRVWGTGILEALNRGLQRKIAVAV